MLEISKYSNPTFCHLCTYAGKKGRTGIKQPGIQQREKCVFQSAFFSLSSCVKECEGMKEVELRAQNLPPGCSSLQVAFQCQQQTAERNQQKSHQMSGLLSPEL